MMDLAKLKVVDLRAELGQRGLDTKGNKPVLIERLRKALEEESGDPKSAADASAQDTDEENAGKASHREARERTPEPVPPKTPGRSSRSSATPSKAASHRGNPKILLTPLTEKQITPTKSPPAEKTEKALPEKSEKATPEKQDKVSPEKQVKTTPEKQVKATPEKQVKTTPEKQVKTTPEKQVKTTPEKQMKASPEKQEKTPPAKQEKTSPAKQEKTSPAKQEKTSPEKQEKTSPEKQEKTSPEKQEKTSPETQEKATPEKQEKATPEKQEKTSPRKQEKISPLINEAPPDEAKEATKSKDDIQPQEEAAPEHLEAVNQAVETETGADQPEEFRKDEETSDDVIEKQTEPASEKSDEINKPAIEAEETVKENEKEEETPAAVPDVSEDTKVDTEETAEEKNYEENVEATAEEAENAEEKPQVPEIENEDNLLEDEAMETNEENEENEDKKDFGEPMEMKSECTEEDESTDQTTETTDQTTETTDQTTETTEQSTLDDLKEEKPDIELKEEVDDKSDVQRTLAQNEEDVEMTDIKEESQEDLDQDSKDRDRRDRRDRKRKRSSSPQEDRHKSPQPSYKDDEPDLKDSEVVLSWYDSDLNLVINRESFVSATAMHNDGFGYIWAGARASFGFTEGKVYYESKITECCDINLPDEAAPHVLRVGWSILGTTMQLGEEPLTYGFGGTGKISTGNRFIDYGEAFGKDDVIGCYVDFTAENNVVISYTKNGRHLGTAFTISKSTLGDNALFPHVLTKNCTFECNFGQEKSWCEDILEGYVPVGFVDIKDRTPGPRRPEKRGDCEIIMMCGLPAAGKTVWATKYAQDHPERMYNVLGTNALIEKMKVIGLPRKRNYHGRWEVLITKCTRCLNKLLDLAATRRRNYILDQTNVYPSAQRRKMRSFYGYMRRAVVLVPTEEEFKARTIKRTACEGEVAPESAVLEMKANFGIPVVGESFDVIEWAELPEVEARKLVEKYNKEGKDAGFGQQQPSKRPRFESRDNHRESRDNRQSSRDSRDSRDHRDRRNNYPDRSRTSTWRGGSNSGGGGGSAWRDRQPRPAGGHVRHGGGSGGYGGPSGGGWRGRGAVGGPPSSYRPPVNDRRVPVHDRRTSGSDRNRSAPTRQGGWGPMNSYQSSQQSSGGWGGSQSGNWPSSQSQQQGSWGGQQTWGQAQHQQQQQQQQWGNWKGYGTYGQQSSYGHQGYGNGNWGSWNQQYYNQYWGQQQPTSQTSAAGSQAVSATGSTTTGNSTASTGSTYSSYSPAWQGYAQSQSYSFPAESSNTNAQQQK